MNLERRTGWLTAIGVFKLAKCAALVAGGVLALAHNHALRHALVKYGHVDDHFIARFSWLSFPYAALFAVEGIGLLRDRRWAEWLTVVTTSLLIPVEIFEIAKQPSPLKIAALVVNVAAVAYLIARLFARHRQRIAIAA